MERTLILIKPDAVQRNLVGRVIARFEDKGLKLVGMKMVHMTPENLDEHYSHLCDKPYFAEIRDFMASVPLIATCWEGLDAVACVRGLCGITKAREAESGTIRGDWAMSIQTNLVHASDSLDTASAEIDRFFDISELFTYDKILESVLYSRSERG